LSKDQPEDWDVDDGKIKIDCYCLDYRYNKKLRKVIKVHPVFKVPVIQRGNG
jgi:hypothetical protein